MIHIAIHSPSWDDLAALEQIYVEAFPPEERRSWRDVVTPAVADCPQLNAIYADGQPVGLVTLWRFAKFIYIEHFALAAPMRGRGIGGRVLDYLAQGNILPIVVEVERDATHEAQRRIAFYQRHGFTLVDYDYIQPPYAPGLPSVPLWLMMTSAIPPESVAQTLHREVYQKV